ncbi:MAG: hypothetical protein JRI23_11990 [Deltaproteobacteria bacterium]|nr:hypothetical protein [Deltaproteobacteria bacterium]MBW2532429.1 hypothetical protein [Deltaproteobacteria bacterium]
MTAIKEQQERLKRHAGTVAASHWRRLLRRIRAGEDVAAECEGQLLARDDDDRALFARQSYGEAQVALLAALEPRALTSLMAPWLDEAISYLLGDWEPVDGPESGDRNPERSYLERLVCGQYVVVVQEQARKGDGGAVVRGFPSEQASLGRLCEFCASETSGSCTLRLYKATGGPFTESELEASFDAMREGFFAGAEEEGQAESWLFEWANEGEDDRVIVVEVHQHFAEEGDDEDEGELEIVDQTPLP